MTLHGSATGITAAPNGVNRAEASKILELAKGIASKAEEIIIALEKQSLPLPSLGASAPQPDFIPALDTQLQGLRRRLVSDARLLADTFTGTRKLLEEHLQCSVHNITAMRVLYTFNLAKHVPAEDTTTFAQLSAVTGVDEPRLTRILRYLMLNNVFIEPEPGKVAHSALSKFLLANDAVGMDFMGHMLEEALPGAISQTDAMQKASSEETPELDCGFAVALGDSKSSYFDVTSQQPERMKRFGRTMKFMSSPGGHNSIERVLTSFDWAGLGAAEVVDVGGSLGHVAVDLLKYAPSLKKIIVQDLPDVIKEARTNPLPQAAEVADRLEFEEASFFDPQPVKTADVYLFRHVFHDWPQQKAEQIVRNVVPSMKPGSRLIVAEYVLYPTGEDDPYSSKMARLADMQMMVLLNAKERSLADWKLLLEGASGGDLLFEQAKGPVVVFRKK